MGSVPQSYGQPYPLLLQEQAERSIFNYVTLMNDETKSLLKGKDDGNCAHSLYVPPHPHPALGDPAG